MHSEKFLDNLTFSRNLAYELFKKKMDMKYKKMRTNPNPIYFFIASHRIAVYIYADIVLYAVINVYCTVAAHFTSTKSTYDWNIHTNNNCAFPKILITKYVESSLVPEMNMFQ